MVRWLCIVLCGSCLIWVGDTQAVVLGAQSSEPLSFVPAAVAAQDMNWNSTPDLVVANPAANSVTVMTNNGVTNLTPKFNYAVGSNPVALAVADFSGDGYFDIAVANQGSNDISILNNKAVAGVEFNAATSYAAGSGPVAIAAGLFNNDAYNDLAVVNKAGNAITVLLNSGTGTFPSAVSYGVGVSPTAIAAADFDGNGTPDLAVANQGDNTVSLLLNNGSGLYSPSVSYAAGSSPSAIAVLDVDHNGTMDIAVTNSSTAAVSWLSNNGNGTFVYMAYYSVGAIPSSLIAVDMNGDGYDDLAVASEGVNAVSVLENSRNGAFAVPVAAAVGTTPVAIAAADLDCDGDKDLMTANSGVSTLSLLMNNTDFQPNPFPFTAQVDVPLNAVVESNVVTLSGMGGWSQLTVSGGEYAFSRNSGVSWSAWSTLPVLVTAGDQIKLRTTSAAAGHVLVEAQVNVSRTHEIFSVTTIGDAVPDPFAFIDKSDVALNTLTTSDPVTVTGIDVAVPITVIAGAYSVNGAAYTSAPGTVRNNDSVQLRVTSSPLSGGVVSVVISIGGIRDTFRVTSMMNGQTGNNSSGGGVMGLSQLVLMLLWWILRKITVKPKARYVISVSAHCPALPAQMARCQR